MITHAYTTDIFRIPQFGPSPEQRRAAHACGCGGASRSNGVVINLATRDQDSETNPQAAPSTQSDQDHDLAGILAILDYLKQLDARVAALESGEGAQSNAGAQPSGPMDRDDYLQRGALAEPDNNEPLSPSVAAAREKQIREAGCAELSPFHYNNDQPIPRHENNAMKLMGSNPPGSNNNNLNGGLGNSAPPGGGPYAAAVQQSPREGEANPRNSQALMSGSLGRMRRNPDQHNWTLKAQDQLPFIAALAAPIAGIAGEVTNKLLNPSPAEAATIPGEKGGTDDQLLETLGTIAKGFGYGAAFLGANELAGSDRQVDQESGAPAQPNPKVQQQGAGADATTGGTTGDVVRVNRYLKSQLASRPKVHMADAKVRAQALAQARDVVSRNAELARNRKVAEQVAAAYRKKG
jgi:hypothetical protein